MSSCKSIHVNVGSSLDTIIFYRYYSVVVKVNCNVIKSLESDNIQAKKLTLQHVTAVTFTTKKTVLHTSANHSEI